MFVKEYFDCQDGIVRADLRGIVTDETWSYVFCKTLALAGIHRSRNMLIDLRGSQVPNNVLSVYNLPPVLEYISLTKRYRIAVVTDSRVSDRSFFDTVFRNRGFTAQMFTDYEDARNWLRPGDQNLN